MTSRRDNNRARFYRRRAEYLLREAEAEFVEERRLHLLSLAESFARAARQVGAAISGSGRN
jgi:hypothetical protein